MRGRRQRTTFPRTNTHTHTLWTICTLYESGISRPHLVFISILHTLACAVLHAEIPRVSAVYFTSMRTWRNPRRLIVHLTLNTLHNDWLHIEIVGLVFVIEVSPAEVRARRFPIVEIAIRTSGLWVDVSFDSGYYRNWGDGVSPGSLRPWRLIG